MLTEEIRAILAGSREYGWVLEPDAKRLLHLAGIGVPKFLWAQDLEEAYAFAEGIGYPVAAKVVSPAILHKTEAGGVVLGIRDREGLARAYEGFRGLRGFRGMLVEETVSGAEMILGGKVDMQFGPIVLMGVGGTLAEIYRDTALRMAPIAEKDVLSMLHGLKAHQIFEGYRGAEPVDLPELSRTLVALSHLMMDLQDEVSSLDLNPVICRGKQCLAADARILLKGGH